LQGHQWLGDVAACSKGGNITEKAECMFNILWLLAIPSRL
jgi:hypothetical protein